MSKQVIYHNPDVINAVAKEQAWSMAKPIFALVLSLSMIAAALIAGALPPAHYWLISISVAFAAGSLVYSWIYYAKGVSSVVLTLDVDHTEETAGITYGDYQVKRPIPPTPDPVS